MKYIKVIILFLCVSLFENCTQKNNIEKPKELHTIEIKKDFLLSEVNEPQFEALDTIDLERPGNPSLTSIWDIAFTENHIFLVDVKQGFLKYDYEGNFLKKIGKKGEGPDEYLTPMAIYADEKENIALVGDYGKMVVNSYDLEGNYISTSKKLPGLPISFYREEDRVLVIQEGRDFDKEGLQTVLISSIVPTTLELKHPENSLYSFTSKFNKMHSFPSAFGQLNDTILFYFPRILGFDGIIDHKDTIYRMEEDHLVPEYQLDFTDFPKSDTVQIDLAEINQGYASILVGYKKESYHLMLDLQSKTPKFRMRLPSEGYSFEVFPKHLNADTYFTIIRNQEGSEEENPKIVLSTLNSGNNKSR